MSTYTTYVPYFISCPKCGMPHQTKRETAECWLAGERKQEDLKSEQPDAK